MSKQAAYIAINSTLLAILLALLLSACSVQKPLVTKSARDSVRVETQIRIDSVFRDRWHTEYVKGDTLHIIDSVFMDRWHFERKTDSVCIRDTIREPYEVQVPVRKRNDYDRATARGFWILLSMLVLRVAWWCVKKYYLRR